MWQPFWGGPRFVAAIVQRRLGVFCSLAMHGPDEAGPSHIGQPPRGKGRASTKKKAGAWGPPLFREGGFQPRLMASQGQAPVHAPHSMQTSALISALPSTISMAETGHSPTHVPQPPHFSLSTTAAIIIPPGFDPTIRNHRGLNLGEKITRRGRGGKRGAGIRPLWEAKERRGDEGVKRGRGRLPPGIRRRGCGGRGRRRGRGRGRGSGICGSGRRGVRFRSGGKGSGIGR